MGKLASTGNEMATQVVSGTFAATGQSGNATTGSGSGNGIPGQTVPASFTGTFNYALWGTFVATVVLERSFDGGTTWNAVTQTAGGSAASFTAAVNSQFTEWEAGVLFRFNCTAYTSGTVNYRISK